MTESTELEILYEDNHLLAVNKPVRLATMGLPEGEETLLTRAKAYIAQRYAKPGNVYLGVVSRLDVPVSGVVLFARTSKAAERINAQFRDHRADKRYLAVVEGKIPPEGTLRDLLAEDKRHRSCYVTKGENLGKETKTPQTSPKKEGILHFKKITQIGLDVKHIESCSLVEIRLETGRKHQIRVQLSHFGYPILGDRKYGGRVDLPAGIALHARSLTVAHPTRDEMVRIVAPFPSFWGAFGTMPEGF